MRAEGLTGVSVTPSVVRISEVPACVVAMVKASAQRIVARRSCPGAISSQARPPSSAQQRAVAPRTTVGERKYTSRTAASAWRTSAQDSAPSVVR